MNPVVCLTLLLPQVLEEEVIDLLLQHPEWDGGPFIASEVEGHGATGQMFSVHEQVRGRTLRTRIDILVNAAAVPVLLEALGQCLTGTAIDWWLTPVIDHGTFSS